MFGGDLWLTCWVLLATVMVLCRGHGRLADPPSRASAWRFGFNTPKDYNDNEGFCGGFNYQYQMQGGRCGICGDAWDEKPRPHEAGGKYATGTIVRRYTQGQVMPVVVDIDSNHRGHFEFRICPNNNPKVEASQTCLNEHPLFLADGSGFKYTIGQFNGDHKVQLQLPPDLTCTQCVFQWRYVAGNNWGTCEDGTGAVGCGPQEEFRACADIAIVPRSTSPWSSSSSGGGGGSSSSEGQSSTDEEDTTPDVTTSSYLSYSTPTPTPTLSPTEKPPPPPLTTTSRRPRPPTPNPATIPSPTAPPSTTTTDGGGGGACKAVGVWQQIPGMDQWCVRNCNHTPSFCPSSHCTCN